MWVVGENPVVSLVAGCDIMQNCTKRAGEKEGNVPFQSSALAKTARLLDVPVPPIPLETLMGWA